MRSKILWRSSYLRKEGTPTPLEFFNYLCAFQVKLLSMYMPRNLVEMVKKNSSIISLYHVFVGIYNFLTGLEEHSSTFVNIYI